MLKFLFGIIFFGIIFIILLFFIGIGFLRSLFGDGRSQGQQNNRQNSSTRFDSPQHHQPTDHKKVFDNNEGEYVDFEEIEEKR